MAEENVHKQTSDDILVSLARSGDLDAIDALIDRYYNICFRTCMTILRDQDHASDACQNCFLKIVKNIDKYRGDGSFRGWALTIARNESLGFLRRRKVRKEVLIEREDRHTQEEKQDDISDDVITRMEASMVRKAFSCGFSLSILCKAFSVISTGDTCFFATNSRSLIAGVKASSLSSNVSLPFV